ncbi:MAG: helix-turn-helix transcriptional regulator [Acidobacteria bacterium]|nr:helix-turn-helix transcriptional regulator [Acidobacteriota bacterium]
MGEFAGIGKALKRLRQRRGVSQQELAAASGLTAPMISNYELGKVVPQIPTLDAVLKALGADRFELINTLEEVNGRPRRHLALEAPPSPESEVLEILGLGDLDPQEQVQYLRLLTAICHLLGASGRSSR